MKNNSFILALYGSFDNVAITLFKNFSKIDGSLIQAKFASKNLISEIDILLKKYDLMVKDLSLIMADAGPGAFTSLRVIVVTANGLAFASNVPVLAIDPLREIALDVSKENNDQDLKDSSILAIFNAYGNQFYCSHFDMAKAEFVEQKVCVSEVELINKIQKMASEKRGIILTGDGVALLQKKLYENKEFDFSKVYMIGKVCTDISLSYSLQQAEMMLAGKRPLETEIIPQYVKAGFATSVRNQ